MRSYEQSGEGSVPGISFELQLIVHAYQYGAVGTYFLHRQSSRILSFPLTTYVLWLWVRRKKAQ